MFNSIALMPRGKIAWLIAAIIVLYYVIILLCSANFPYSDDFDLLDFVSNFSVENAGSIYAQHNEHRIVTTRLIYLLNYWISGEINFRHLILVGNLFHLGTFFLIIKHLPEFPQKRYFVLFTACMIFQFGAAESALFSTAAISSYLVFTLALLTLSLLYENSLRAYIFAIIIALLAVFTIGNGLMIPFIAAAYLAAHGRYRESLIMTGVSLLVVYIYFLGYTSPGIHTNPIDSLRHIGKVLVFAISFTGSAFGVGGSHYPLLTTFSLIPTLIVGSLIWGTTIYGFYKKRYVDGNIFIWFNLFIILTAIVTAMSRLDFGLSQSMVSRYHINSNLAVVTTAALLLQLPPIKQIGKETLDRFFKVVSIFALTYFVATFALLFYFYAVIFAPVRAGTIVFHDRDSALEILERANDSRIFIRRSSN